MRMRIPFFGLVAERSPMAGLLDHYGQIEAAMSLIQESLLCYIGGGRACKDFQSLKAEVDQLEEAADKIKRRIRNHLPRGLFMAVDKTLFLNYTRAQDNILDEAQDALDWLSMRTVSVPEEFRAQTLDLVDEAVKTVETLKPALESTVRLVHSDIYDRKATKETYQAVRDQHKKVRLAKAALSRAVYESDLEFKAIYQLLHFFDGMHSMSHNAENCADILRAMIAR
ncbi:putative phosphate transport regulator [Alkalidesulfovibrio alkalitolerans DSM 16529]|uniref:Putative phosphate transport regulator n=1 Tax=Alkalidesulfovibrio alkalitolerans DSM 16529 TaxID=1121439 RepID=S7T7A1_9BACT|nr:DUF47 family protein [Alkalidesulfovibrio alkalitolerans]EPR32360.1 putative phosphate transport regulator [Alkalidesulfovibrio alkalitolerans DSM 16529]